MKVCEPFDIQASTKENECMLVCMRMKSLNAVQVIF